MNLNHLPEGYTSLTPGLAIRNAAAAIDWYKRVFNAREVMRLNGPNGVVVHAELEIGNARLMLGEEDPAYNTSPATLGGTALSLNYYVEDADSVFNRALENGATEIHPLQDQFYGDRSGRIQDPFGHQWIIAQYLETVPADEMQSRMEAWYQEQQ